MTYVLIGQNYWGRGSSLTQAKSNFRQQGGLLSNGYTLLIFDAETEFAGVDEVGRYHYDGNPPEITEFPPKVAA